jgi:tetratricopeptide (TPR) repeat protein
MKPTASPITVILLLNLALGSAARAQDTQLPPGAISSFEGQKSSDRGEEAYAAGKRAVLEGNWQQALDSYSQVIKAGRGHVDEALYWQAYSQNKTRQYNPALATIQQLKREYPRSQWIKDAGALELEIRQATGKTPEPDKETDCDLKLLAISSLLNSDSERAVPIIEKLLSNGGNAGQCKGQILEKALFVLSQSDSPRAHELMFEIGTGKLHPELQIKAIHYLGISGNHDALSKVYATTSNTEAKKAVLHSFGISGGCSELGAAVQKETDPHLLTDAIHSMGIGGCRQQIRELYGKATSVELKRDILHSTIISGDTELQEKVALSDTDPRLKADAIKDLGISGADTSILTKIYQGDQNPEVRDAVIDGLFIKGDAHGLIELARKETNSDLKKRIVQKLSIMGNREATDYLMEILNK